eukprot:1763679-Rhodomonas_salina.1
MQFHLTPDGQTHMFTRNGYDRNHLYASIVQKIKTVLGHSVQSVILDGELLVFDNQNKSYTPWGALRTVATIQNDKQTQVKINLVQPDNTITLTPSSVFMQHDASSYLEDGALEQTPPSADLPRFMTQEALSLDLPDQSTLLHLQNMQLCFMVFDILHLNGKDLVHTPLYARKTVLHDIINERNHMPGSVQATAFHYGHSATDVFKHLQQ